MDEGLAKWEEIAAHRLGQTGCDDPPVDAFELADCLGLQVVEVVRTGAELIGNTIEIDVNARDVRKHGLCAHETGHWCLRQSDEPDTEDAARFLSGALMLPRQPFDRDLRETGWDLRQLRARHINASAEMIARRIVTLREAAVCIWDNGKLKDRVVTPWIVGMGTKPSRYERELAKRALDADGALHEDELIWAFQIFTPGYRRVITVVEAEQLSLRLR